MRTASGNERGLTPKQEAFCLAYIETGNASEAYRRAYNVGTANIATVNRSAKEVLENPKIAARLAALRERAVERTMVTVDMLTERLLKIADKGEEKDSESGYSVARASLMDIAKLNGLVVDKKEHSGSISLGAALDTLDD